jgi:hypothetical protein
VIQFIKGYYHEKSGRKFVIGQKATIWREDEIVAQGFAVKTTHTGTFKKLKTDFFKPKE